MIIQANAAAIPLRDECVQVCVCSPPYYQLRKYSGLGDAHYGREPTLDAYLANTVEIFREVWRVLKPSGTLWLNVGSSYASANGSGSNRLPLRLNVPECGSDDIEQLGSSDDLDCAYSGLCDEHLADFLNHRGRIAYSSQPHQPASLLRGKRVRGNERLDLAGATVDSVALDAQESTSLESWRQLRGECSRCASREVLVSQLRQRSFSLESQGYARKFQSDCKRGTSQQVEISERRMTDKVLSSKAWRYLTTTSLKAKDDMALPWLVALTLRMDGWYLRSAITLCKRAPMPESVTDRPTQATEMLFLLTKQADYYYDQIAVMEPHTRDWWNETVGREYMTAQDGRNDGGKRKGCGNPKGRNLRNWIELTTEPNCWATCSDCHHTTDRWPKCAWCGGINDLEDTFRNGKSYRRNHAFTNGALPVLDAENKCPRCHGKQICPGCGSTNIIGHFAAFPTKIPELAIKAGTSEKGECAKCGAQVERVVEASGGTIGASWHNHEKDLIRGQRLDQSKIVAPYRKDTTGWRATCKCNAGTRPNLVCDPFVGSGTTLVAAQQLGRRGVGAELSSSYIRIAKKRTSQLSFLFAQTGGV